MAIPSSPAAQDLFAEVFGDSQQQEVLVPAFRSGVFLGEVSTLVSRSEVRVALQDVVRAVDGIVDDPTRELLESRLQAGAPTFVALVELGDAGITATFREQDVELDLVIAPERLREQILNENLAPVLENLREPEPWSGYINLRSTALLSTAGAPDSLQAEFEPVVRFGGLVAEGSLTLATVDAPVSLNTARLVWDRADLQLRVNAGTPLYRVGGQFAPAELWGVSVTRSETLSRANPLFAAGRVEFVVPERTPVEIVLNGRVFRTYTLNEGPHTLLDMPLGRGTNRVQVIAGNRDSDGGDSAGVSIAEQRVHFAPGLLVRGRHDYSYALGVLRDTPTRPYLSAFHRFGLLSTVTVGAAAAATLERFGVGVTGLLATLAGVSDLSVSLTGPEEVGFSADLSHVVSILPAAFPPTVELIVSGRNGAYREVVSGLREGAAVEAGVAYSQRLPARVVAGLGVVQRWDLEDSSRNETGVRLSTSFQTASGFAVNAQIGPRFSAGEVAWQGSVFVRLSDEGGGVTATTGYDVVDGPARLAITSIPRQPFGSLRWTAGYEGVDLRPGQPQTIDGSATWEGYRMNATLSPSFRSTIGASSAEARVAAGFSSALVVAGGAVAVARPIEDSFVILRPRALIADYEIPVRGTGGGVSAIIAGRPTVVSNLQSYRGTTLQLDGANLPDGFSVGVERHGFQPPYRGGYLVEVGSGAAVYVQGRLVDSDGQAIDLQVGEVVAADGTSTLFFTNEEGAFEVTGLTFGEYRVTLLQVPGAESLFAVPPDVVGRYDLGDVVFLLEEDG